MDSWWQAAAVGVGLLLTSWLILVLLARRLPPGVMKELAGFLPNCVRLARRLRAHPDVPKRAKVAVVFAGLWVLSPIDPIPEFLPVIGPLDDVVVVALALRYAARTVPRATLLAAWDGDPATIDRLLGRRCAADVPQIGSARMGRVPPTRPRELLLQYFPDCPNWRVADERLRAVADDLGLTLGYELVTTPEQAELVSFRGSPTILIDGVDPFAVGGEPIGLSCRLYRTPDGSAGSPTTAQIAAALAADE